MKVKWTVLNLLSLSVVIGVLLVAAWLLGCWPVGQSTAATFNSAVELGYNESGMPTHARLVLLDANNQLVSATDIMSIDQIDHPQPLMCIVEGGCTERGGHGGHWVRLPIGSLQVSDLNSIGAVRLSGHTDGSMRCLCFHAGDVEVPMNFESILKAEPANARWVNLFDPAQAKMVEFNPRDPLGVQEYLRRNGYVPRGLYISTGEDTASILSQAVPCQYSVGVQIKIPL